MKNKIYPVCFCLLSVVLLLSSCFKVVPDASTTPVVEQPTTSPSPPSPSPITAPQATVTPETTLSTPVTIPTTTPAPIPPSTTPPVTPSSPAPVNPSPTKPPSERASIAFTRYNNATWEERIYTVKNDGTDLKKLTAEDNVQEHFPDFSPDGKKIVFAKMVKGGQFDVYVMNSDGSGRVNLTNTPDIREDMPAWSPDGQQIAFSLSNDIYVMAADGTKLVQLTTDKGFDWVPAWSPDGKEIAFLSDRDGNWKWWVMKADGSNQRLLADIMVMEEARGVPVFLLKGTWSLKFPGTFFSPLLTKEKQCVISIDVEKGKQGNITYGDSKNYLEARGNNSPVVTLYTSKTSSLDIYNAWGTPVKEIVNTSDHEIAGSCVELVPGGQTPALTPPTSPSPPTSPTITQTPPLPSMDAFMKGIWFNDYGWKFDQPRPREYGPVYHPPQADPSLKALAATGANWINIIVAIFQENLSSTNITSNQYKTASDAALRHVIDLAHSLGIRVVLIPALTLSNDPEHSWVQIGTAFTDDTQWQAWFASYREHINHYASFAREAGVDMFYVGSELPGTTYREDDWRQVVKEVRERFKGPISYDSVAWGSPTIAHGDPTAEYKRIKWWDALDYICTDFWQSLTTKNDPTIAELKQGWENTGFLTSFEEVSKQFNKPAVLSEIGYDALDGTAKNYQLTNRTVKTVDLQEQADCYQVALEMVMGRSWLKGVFWFQWNAISIPEPWPGDPHGKPAEEVLKKFYLDK